MPQKRHDYTPYILAWEQKTGLKFAEQDKDKQYSLKGGWRGTINYKADPARAKEMRRQREAEKIVSGAAKVRGEKPENAEKKKKRRIRDKELRDLKQYLPMRLVDPSRATDAKLWDAEACRKVLDAELDRQFAEKKKKVNDKKTLCECIKEHLLEKDEMIVGTIEWIGKQYYRDGYDLMECQDSDSDSDSDSEDDEDDFEEIVVEKDFFRGELEHLIPKTKKLKKNKKNN